MPEWRESDGVIRNEISRGRARDGETPLTPSGPLPHSDIDRTESDAAPPTNSAPLPAFVRRHFVRTGERFYYRQQPDKLAFRAGKDSLRAEDVSESVATAMVEMAAARGWSALKVKGSREFKQLVWAAAAKRGMAVEGHTPTPGERALAEDRSSERPASNRPGPEEQERLAEPLAGELLSYGPAPYQHHAGTSPSFQVRVRSADGREHTHWGVDLERALKASGAQIGDEVTLERRGREPVTVREPVRDGAGVVIDHATRTVERNAWSVEVRERGGAVRPRLPETPPPAEPRGTAGRRAEAPDRLPSIGERVGEAFARARLGHLSEASRAEFRRHLGQILAKLQSERGASPPPNEISRGRERLSPDRSR